MPAARTRSKRPLAGALAAAACALLCIGAVSAAGERSSAEYEIKAAFIYNFAKFVHWPDASFAQSQAPLNVCLIGEDPFGAALGQIDRKVAQGHELRIRRQIRLDEARSCHVLFIAESERARLASILRTISGASVLTVSDMDRFAESGGIIGLFALDNKVQFAINLDQAHAALLDINSQLLKLAKIVRRDAQGDGQ